VCFNFYKFKEKMMFKNLFTIVATVAVLLGIVPQTVAAHPVLQVTCDQDAVVQADDWLSKLADKFYGDILAYPAIVEATNQANATDDSYARIDNPDLIEPGWKLCIPSVEDAGG